MSLSEHVRRLITLAVNEDLGSGDITSEATIPADLQGASIFIAKEPLVVCGHQVAQAVFAEVDSDLEYQVVLEEGAHAATGATIAQARGSVRGLLAAERTALNFLQRLSGVATQTAQAVASLSGTGLQILDTRKTTPGWRELEKHAVRSGGGNNHRMGLYDAVLIKDNHVDAIGGDIRKAIRAAREYAPRGTKIEVEVRSMAELALAVEAEPDAILLDNMNDAELTNAVAFVREKQARAIELEASGGVTLDRLQKLSNTGIDSVSLGMLTHSAPAVDISMKFVQPE